MLRFATLLVLALAAAIGCSDQSTPLQSNDLPANLPEGQTAVQVEVISPIAARITWADPTNDAREYELLAQWGEDTAFYPIQRVPGLAREMVWEGCDRPTIYRVKVRKVLPGVYSEPSQVAIFLQTRTIYVKDVQADIGSDNYQQLLDVSPDGEMVAMSDGWVQLRETTSGRLIRQFPFSGGGVTAGAFMPDGRKLVLGDGSRVDIVNTLDGSTERVIRAEWDDLVQNIFVTPDGRSIILTGGYGQIEIIDLELSRGLIIQNGEIDPFWGSSEANLSPDGRFIAMFGAYSMPMVKIYSVGTGKLVKSIAMRSWECDDIAFSPDGSLCAIDGDCIYNTSDWSIYWDIPAGGEMVFTADGKQIVTAGLGIQVWDLEAKALIPSNLMWGIPEQSGRSYYEQFGELLVSKDNRYLVGLHYILDSYGDNPPIRLTAWL